MERQPFIVGPTTDMFLGFLAGFFGSVLGVVATVVVMFMWVGRDGVADVAERRQHAERVAISSVFGLVAEIAAAVVVIATVVIAVPR